MLFRTLGATIVAMLMATASQAVEVTFAVNASGPFLDGGVGPFNGTITGTFTVDDDGDNLIETGEITAFSFIADLANDDFDVTISSAAGATVTVLAGTPGTVFGSLTSTALDFTFLDAGDSIGDIFVLNALLGEVTLFAEADPNFANLASSNVTISQVGAVPLPAPLAMMLGGLAVFGVVARRRKRA